ncbi:MAG: hypothetical protein C5B54_04125 [Acidobacteria bacterium]|nr:MAG: hypothetical protein C5B54_04125 [Acidobacteriota bacterium]
MQFGLGDRMLNFPNAPNVDDMFANWRWDGEKWIAARVAGSNVYIGINPPSNPNRGDLWWNDDVLSLWVGTDWVVVGSGAD